MKKLMSFAIALFFVGTATPVLAQTWVQVEILGDAKFGGGTARTSQLSREAAAKAKVKPKPKPTELCFAPRSGNFMKASLPRQTQRSRTTCARTSANRLN
jgi:hypothetical protein